MDERCIVVLIVFALIYSQALNNSTNCTVTFKQYCASMDCSNRNLTTVPANLPSATCELNLHRNFIYKLRNDSFSMYPKLIFLNVSSNHLLDIESGSFVGLGKLRVLDLSSNFLSFANTSEYVFSPLTMLESLDLSNNSYLSYPQSVISHLKSLESINMDGFMMRLGKGFMNLEKLAHISLSGSKGKCKIDYLSDEIFKDVPNITSLDLSYCRIFTVQAGALNYLHNIQTLNISWNIHLGLEGIKNATMGLQTSRLKTLVMNQIVGKHTIGVMVLEEHIQHLQNSSLEWIETNDNNIELFNVDVFSLLPKSLKYANIRSSRFTYGAYLWYLQNLTGLIHVDLSGRPGVRNLPFADSDDDPLNCRGDTEPHNKEWLSCPGINEGYRYHFHIINGRQQKQYYQQYVQSDNPVIQTTREPFGISPNLVTFKYSNAMLAFELAKIRIAKNSLRHVDLSYNIFTTWKGPIFGLENITDLDLSGNIARKVCPNFFANFYSLKKLNISHNFVGSSFDHNQHRNLLRNQQNLEVLDMSLNSIMYLHFDVLMGLKSLQVLNISRNLISNISLNYKHNKKLTHINCAYNMIKWIDSYGRAQMSKLAKINNFSLDLSHNYLQCTCETLDFLEWFLDSNIHPLNLDHTYCINDNSHFLQLNNTDILDDMRASCRSYFDLSMGSMAAFVFIISLMVSAISYRYRWRLTYWYYIAKLKLKKQTNKNQNLDQFDFDMYIAYADSDLDFVCRDMIYQLETKRGTRLYIRDRDALPGAPIAENIIDGIRRSKKTVLLLSETFLKKKWCRYELHMANMESVSTGLSVMVIVMLEDIPNKDIPPEILYEVQNSRFIDYPQDGNELEHFWANMHISIQT